MHRVFMYHGAEHKTIFAYESGEELTVANAAKQPRLHPRCGTSFLIIVMLVSIVVFVFLGKPETLGDRLLRFAMIPVIGGIAFEFIKLSAKPLPATMSTERAREKMSERRNSGQQIAQGRRWTGKSASRSKEGG